MYSGRRRKLTYANVVATLALVFAMSGGAYAASKYIITSTKQINPKVLSALKGKNGKNGVNGTNGVNGAAGKEGAPGPAGEKGAAGTNGTEGKAGTAGTSVTTTELAKGNSHCPEGGSELVAGSKKTYACNGSPWVAGGTLPANSNETGAWDVRSTASSKEEVRTTSISFPIPLATKPPNVLFVAAGSSTPAHCTGNVENPGAETGYLCIFESGTEGILGAIHKGGLSFTAATNPGGSAQAGTTGAELVFQTLEPKTAPEEVSAEGTWAVAAG